MVVAAGVATAAGVPAIGAAPEAMAETGAGAEETELAKRMATATKTVDVYIFLE